MTKVLCFIKKKWVDFAIIVVILIASIGGIVFFTSGIAGGEPSSTFIPESGKEDAVSVSSEKFIAQTPESEIELAVESKLESEEASTQELAEGPEEDSTMSEESGSGEISPAPSLSDEELVFSRAPRNDWFWGYVPVHEELGEMDSNLVKEIRQAYIQQYRSYSPESFPVMEGDIIVSRYFGTYNGYAAVHIYDQYDICPPMTYEHQVDDVIFRDGGPNFIRLYKDGRFFSIQKAYETMWISNTDLKDIAYYYYQGVPPLT